MAAPKGNKHAVGHGRPPIHTDPKEVERLCNDYFQWIEGEAKQVPKYIEVATKDGETSKVETGEYETQWIRHPEPPTVTGLTLHLGFCNKSSLYDYAEKDSFSNSIKRAISRIEKFHEIAITRGDKCVGNIFALKNFGWTDRSEIDHNIKSEQPLFGNE